MKLILIALISISTFAKVGQKITHKIDIAGKSFDNTQEVTSFDETENVFIIKDSIKVAGITTSFNYKIKKELMFTKVRALAILAGCVAAGGEIERVNKIKACKIAAGDLPELDYELAYSLRESKAITFWFGAVPIQGIVKAAFIDKVSTTVTDFDWN
ncbi:MAG: hypothetical protein N4A33_11830 [Bacteriovoracaceae bacterium]|jgi:hypothetical protein|nr:hypothetical protein [Bacteriovoracaceae bacterium]